MSEILNHLRKAVSARDGEGPPDGHLLDRFIEFADEDAFAELVRRHAPMVWGVCRRILRHLQDAEDAFQATFLVLVRRAASILPREMVANWLYGVANQTALKARALAARRQAREKQMREMPEPAVTDQAGWRDLRDVLDQALRGLPDKYRVALILCDLEGKTRKEAAQQLGWPEGTVAGRLANARSLLAKRLARQGVALSAGALAVAVSRAAAAELSPAPVVSVAINNLSGVSATAVALAEGVIRSMARITLKLMTMALLAVALLGIGILACFTQADEQPGKAGARKGGGGKTAPPKAGVTLAGVLGKVRQGEARYDNLELVADRTYSIGNREALLSDTFNEATRQQSQIRQVSQGDRLFLSVKGEGIMADKQRQALDLLNLFDGKTTRRRGPDGVVKETAGRVEDEQFLRPHMLLLTFMHFRVPLSTYLAGHEAMAKHAPGRWERYLVLETSYQGVEKFRGLRCHKVWITTCIVGDGRKVPHDRWELWLAEERNYLPVRMRGYTFRFSKEVPIAEGVAEDLREIGPGVWLPFTVRITAYDGIKLQQTGKRHLQWQEEYKVKKATLNPKYDDAFFREMAPEDGKRNKPSALLPPVERRNSVVAVVDVAVIPLQAGVFLHQPIEQRFDGRETRL
jgi:RNA polymerase sigma factor (sigma-70 family)